MPSSSKHAARRHHRREPTAETISQLSTYLAAAAQKGTAMNRYGLLAQEHWRRHAPQRYAALEHPAEFFETLGETAAAQIAELSDRLEQQLPADLGYLERVAQLRTVQKQAEELVLSDLVYSVKPEPANLAEELEELLAVLPSPSMIEDALARLTSEAEEDAEREGWSQPLLSEEQSAQQARLTALLPLVRLPRDPDQMSEAELSDRILALRTFVPEPSSDL